MKVTIQPLSVSITITVQSEEELIDLRKAKKDWDNCDEITEPILKLIAAIFSTDI